MKQVIRDKIEASKRRLPVATTHGNGRFVNVRIGAEHIYRFEDLSTAEVVAANINRALRRAEKEQASTCIPNYKANEKFEETSRLLEQDGLDYWEKENKREEG